jgi:hypothetical protein
MRDPIRLGCAHVTFDPMYRPEMEAFFANPMKVLEESLKKDHLPAIGTRPARSISTRIDETRVIGVKVRPDHPSRRRL